MRVIFAGTPAFASASLQALLTAGFEIPLVLTQPDRPAGRGLKLHASAVKTLAIAHNIPVAQPASLRLDGRFGDQAKAAQALIQQANADLMVVAAYGLILPQWALVTPRLGCVNVHASLLPRWRGAAPIHRAIQSGDAHTGVTIMHMDAGLDTGDMLLAERLAIGAQDTTAMLHDTLADMGARLLLEALTLMASNAHTFTAQPCDGITYANKIDKGEAPLDWRQPADVLLRQVLAFNPFPGATLRLPAARDGESETVKVWGAHVLPSTLTVADSHTVGCVLATSQQGVDVVCGSRTVLRLTELQRAGGKRLAVAQWLGGASVQVGQHLVLPSAVSHL